MTTPVPAPAPISKAALWTGRVMSYLPVPFLLMSASFKFINTPDGTKGFEHLGISMSKAPGLGILELSCLLIYLIPRTAVLGAILMAAYLGGAVAIHMRVDDPFWAQPLLGVFLWGGLWLRDPRLRALIPLRT